MRSLGYAGVIAVLAWTSGCASYVHVSSSPLADGRYRVDLSACRSGDPQQLVKNALSRQAGKLCPAGYRFDTQPDTRRELFGDCMGTVSSVELTCQSLKR
ncbi:hypothetical protein [Dyella silvatica]|uniref:hypothetical protein n=1 Tax=Dyella silvatica TaxID=2992128 RepID=UPI00224E1A1F|nr:hypothetical protein [Dyella silvatica]